MLTSLKRILKKAQREGYALGAFNVFNIESAQAVIAAAEKEKSPVIIQVTEKTFKYIDFDFLVPALRFIAQKAQIPVVLHLDHGRDLKIIEKAIKGGFTSVMFDGSSLSFLENVVLTRKVVLKAHRKKIPVEAELGAIPGKEDYISVKERKKYLTDPNLASLFVQKTGCDFLAISIGTAHGPYKFKGKPYLDFKRLKAIREKVKVPLVLHGASSLSGKLIKDYKKIKKSFNIPLSQRTIQGLPERHIKKAIKLGISKINTDTDLRITFTKSILEIFATKPDIIDARQILNNAWQNIFKLVRKKIKLFGSQGKR